MDVDKILCPVDFSESSDEAVKYATTLAKQSNAELHFVYVHEEQHVDGGFGGYVPPDDIELDRKRLAEVKPSSDDVCFVTEFLNGDPKFQIVKYADDHDIELIVMATHGRTGLMRLLMGSVAEAVVRKASCPVITLKHPVVESSEEEEGVAEGAK